MADVKDQVVEQTTEITETTDKQPEPTSYGFTQDQVDEVVAKRLAREREAIAKKLGVDKYEAVDTFVESVQSTIAEKDKLASELQQVQQSLLDKDMRLSALTVGVKPEYLDRAVKLAQTELSDDVDIAKALDIVLEDFPMLKGGEQPVRKVGSDAPREGSEKSEIDRYLEANYKNSRYFKK